MLPAGFPALQHTRGHIQVPAHTSPGTSKLYIVHGLPDVADLPDVQTGQRTNGRIVHPGSYQVSGHACDSLRTSLRTTFRTSLRTSLLIAFVMGGVKDIVLHHDVV